MATEAGVAPETLAPRLLRLISRGFLAEVSVSGAAGYALTPGGHDLRAALAEAWRGAEADLTGGLRKKHRKALRRALDRFLGWR